MTSISKKCATCEHDLFIRFYDLDQRYYCMPCHPDKVKIIRERRELDDILLGIDSSSITKEEENRLTIFYEKVIDIKNKEIKDLKDKLAKKNKEIKVLKDE